MSRSNNDLQVFWLVKSYLLKVTTVSVQFLPLTQKHTADDTLCMGLKFELCSLLWSGQPFTKKLCVRDLQLDNNFTCP